MGWRHPGPHTSARSAPRVKGALHAHATASRGASGLRSAAQRRSDGKSAKCRACFSSALAAALRCRALAPGDDGSAATGAGVALRNIARSLGTCLAASFHGLRRAVAQSSRSLPHWWLVALAVRRGASRIRSVPMAGRSSSGRAQAACFPSAAGCRGAGIASGSAVSFARRLSCVRPDRCGRPSLSGRGMLGGERQESDCQ